MDKLRSACRVVIIVFVVALASGALGSWPQASGSRGKGPVAHAAPSAQTTLLSASFDSDAQGFSYQDDPFLGTNQPAYADGAYTSSGGFSGGGLAVDLAGVDGNSITDMSGGWSTTINLASAETGVALSLRYNLTQSPTYEFDELSRVYVSVDGALVGRGSKDYVDHVGGDGASGQGNSSTYEPTTGWRQQELWIGDLSAGNHEIVIGGYNNHKSGADEATTILFDDVLLTSGNPAPATSHAQAIVDRTRSDEFLDFIRGLASFGDRCRLSGCGPDYSDFEAAQDWVDDELTAMGYSPVRWDYNEAGTSGTNIWVTKVGQTNPDEMYIVSAHLDGRGGGDAFDDDGSGSGAVLEMARIFASDDIVTDTSIRFIWWDQEEAGLIGSEAYAGQRESLQGSAGEPTWLGLITHDMILYDHGAGSPSAEQSPFADLDVEYRAGTGEESGSRDLALTWQDRSGLYAPDYPSTAYSFSTNTDDTPFHDIIPSISVRENRRNLTSGGNAEWINPNYHQTSDVESSYSADDIKLGYNILRTTTGLVAELSGAQIVPPEGQPEADDLAVTTDEDTAKAISLTGSDPDGDPLSFAIAGGPDHGTLSGTAPNLTYTPDADYNGQDSFTFTVNDGTSSSSPATVSITITPINDAPTADDLDVTVALNTPKAITLSGGDVDLDSLSFAVVGGPDHGTLSGSAPNLIYTPDSGYLGADSFTYEADDGALTSDLATVDITVAEVSPGPVFVDDFESDLGWTEDPDGTDSATTGMWERGDPEGTSSGGVKQVEDAFQGSSALITQLAAGSGVGSFDIDNGDTTIRSPDIELPTGLELTLELQYYLAHTTNSSADDYLRVSVVGPSSSTVLLEELGSGDNDNGAWAPLSANLDAYAGETVHLLIEAADGGGGSIVEAGIDALIIQGDLITPTTAVVDADFDSDAESFGYVDDAFRGTNEPAYASGSYQSSGGFSGGGLRVDLGGIDDDDITNMSGGWELDFSLTNAGSTELSFRYNLTQDPNYEADEYSQGLVSVDGSLVGVSPNDYVAQVTGDGNGGGATTTGWQLVTLDLGTLSAGTHTLRIGAFNNKKTLADESAEILIDDVLIEAENQVQNDPPTADAQSVATDEDSALAITLTGSDPDGDPLTFAVVGGPSDGTLSGAAPNLTYAPDADFNGADSFTFRTHDGIADSGLATVDITVNPVEDAPTADAQSLGTDEDMELGIVLSGSDVDGDPLTYTVVDGPSEGGLSGTAPNLTYTPDADFNGADSFTFRVNDGTSDSNLATIDITVQPVNDAPTADAQAPSTDEDMALAITLTGADIDGDALTFTVVGGPSDGSLGGTAPNLTYTPDADFNGADSLDFVANDGSADSPVATVSITVDPVNDAPTADDQTLETEEDTALAVTLTGADVDGDALTYTVVGGPANGSLSGAAPDLTYTPDAGYLGSDAFTFRTNDGSADSALAQIDITVMEVNDPPTADAQAVATDEDTALAITLTGSDPQSDPLTFTVVGGPSDGSLSGSAPNLTYTPDADFNGSDSFSFRANDGELDSNVAVVSITVDAVNDAPTADAQTVETDEDEALAITLTGADVDGDALTYTVVDGPADGTLSGTAPNLTYTPDSGYTGADAFSFRTNDGTANSDLATVDITVNAAGPVVVFEDDFETDKGWTEDPDGTDSATTGMWERGDPEQTSSGGVKQLGDAFDGSNTLVTARLAGSSVGSNDIDNGVTSIRSPDIDLPADREITLELQYYLAHTSNSSTADFLRITVVGDSGSSVIFEELGAADNDNGAWAPLSASLDDFAGETVHLLVEAADAGNGSIVEAGIDALSILSEPIVPLTVLLDADFDSDAEGFSYVDDAFRGTNEPAYAAGTRISSGGRSGGALQVEVGGIDDDDITDMSGGWERSVTLSSSGELVLSFWYNLTQAANYESDEYSQSLVSVDGTLYGTPPADFIAQVTGDGNGGSATSTGWQLFELSIGGLSAGSHTVTIGGYNNKKTLADESAEVLVDDVLIGVR